ncbi:MAG: 1-(5-phosphoribosyl)-5-[(5-phosphoribosylamino)methylideneamino]imidazole-4-carboxamide isomerase [Clostridiales bacterium]|jgi:phosphoribosylformimino-5-aminoimidazole carboxamide ribotide isomerase|nr:1-(5-phosphoribosyl)-5-[(5-phosphoribosylamino)methylideneamino]imidazole-4-carboxamide isomerase [Clostridiales bacterium]
MNIIPAIDLKDGKCVRLLKGDFSTVHRVADDAVETARKFLDAGAGMIHMVDLDGALDGTGKNRDIISDVITKTGAAVQLGGGIRNMSDIESAISTGVRRAVLGSAAVTNPLLVKDAVRLYADRIAVGIDAADGRVKTRGWTSDAGLDYIEFAKSMESFGVKCIIFTDIDSDGALKGPAFDRLFELRKAVSCEIVASGGVTSISDILKLKEAGIESAILGKAIYAGLIDLKEAIEKAG